MGTLGRFAGTFLGLAAFASCSLLAPSDDELLGGSSKDGGDAHSGGKGGTLPIGDASFGGSAATTSGGAGGTTGSGGTTGGGGTTGDGGATGGGGTTGGGGASGGSIGSGGASGSSGGGTGGTTGGGGIAGSATGGSGGTGGILNGPCSVCIGQYCANERSMCAVNDCQYTYQCALGCSSATCVQACEAAATGGFVRWNQLKQCAAANCASQCPWS